MSDWSPLKERYMRDDVPVRLGGIAANLARVRTYSKYPGRGDIVRNMVDESLYLIEWTAPDAELHAQVELVEMQVQMAGWQLRWESIWRDEQRRAETAELAGKWSDRILELSGLLDEKEHGVES